MEDFDPALFMTVIHATASFNDIRNGLESLDGAKANQVRFFFAFPRDIYMSVVEARVRLLWININCMCCTFESIFIPADNRLL